MHSGPYLYQEFLPGLKEGIAQHAPHFLSFSGTVYYGADADTCNSIVNGASWPMGTWSSSWMGETIHFFENCEPQPSFMQQDPEGPDSKGAYFAKTHAAMDIYAQKLTQAPAVLSIQLECKTVFDIDSAENDELITFLIRKFRAVNDSPHEKYYVSQADFISKVMACNLRQLNLDIDAFRVRYSLPNVGMCWCYAVLNPSVIQSINLLQ